MRSWRIRPAGSAGRFNRQVTHAAKSRDETSADDVGWAIEFFDRAGALDFAQRRAEELIDEGERIIESVPLSPEGREVFHAISNYIVQRKS